MRSTCALLYLIALAACASGSAADPDAAGNVDPIDAPPLEPDAMPLHQDAPPGDPDAPPVEPDAMPIDAMPIDAPPPPVAVTLNQNTDQTTITGANTVTCNQTSTGYTTENNFYRVFVLANHGVGGQFTATHVDFGIEEIDVGGAGTTMNVEVKLHSLSGAFQIGNLTQRHVQTVTLNENLDLQFQQIQLSTPVVFPAGSTVVAEIYVADGVAAQHTFFPGSNAAGESAPSYIRAAGASACDINEPVTFASIGFNGVHLQLRVRGTTP